MINRLFNKNNKRYLIKYRYISIVLALSMILLTGCEGSFSSKVLSENVDKLEQMKKEDESGFKGIIEQIENENSDKSTEEESNSIKVYTVEGALVEPEISVVEYDEDTDRNSDNDLMAASDLTSDLENDFSKHNKCYAYGMLSTKEQNTYGEIYNILNSMTDDVVLSSCDTEEIEHAFKCVMVDYPELFYVSGYSIGKYMIGGILDKVSFSGTYTMSYEEVQRKKAEVEKYITNVIQKIPDGDDYTKIKYIYELMIKSNVYNYNADNDQNILSVIESGQTVCQGYAKTTQLILNRMGIFCTLVNGTAIGTNMDSRFAVDDKGYEAHVWNIVKCDGKYYNLDATWGDSGMSLIDKETGVNPTIEINYEYCLVPDSYLEGTHKPNPVVEMPICDSLDDNYYVREGLYFREVNDNKITAAFEKAYANGNDLVCFKADSKAVYDDLIEYLIDEQNIFNFIDSTNVKYVPFPERNMLLFTI